MNNKHELAVNEIPKTIFSIPHYQRGYRWTDKEVEALLNDLLAFSGSDTQEGSYCLQPLVLQEMADGQLRVVDGQQRLTTIAIILWSLGVETKWDIEYTTEDGHRLKDILREDDRRLKDLLKNPAQSINDHFRIAARKKVEDWLSKDSSRSESLRRVLRGEDGKQVVFLRHDLPKIEDPKTDKDEGHDAFQRLNAGKTPLTSSELIRALYMESGNGLDDGEKADIAKEWDLIESAMADEPFWAVWTNKQFREVPTRMDFLFSIVKAIKPDAARQDTLLIFRSFEESMLSSKNRRIILLKLWEDTLRCWWWMQSCYADAEAFHLLGWLATFTSSNTYTIYRNIWQNKANCRISKFKECLRGLVIDKIGFADVDDFVELRYESGGQDKLKQVFVLLNCLEAEKQHSRFRFELYNKVPWDIEHISSQTDRTMDAKDRENWVNLVRDELSHEDRVLFDAKDGFEDKWSFVWGKFDGSDDRIKESDKDALGNLVLLDSNTNRSYKNAILPVKRTKILFESEKENKYILPCTRAAFSKAYSTHAAQMRYWSENDAREYLKAMMSLVNDFLDKPRMLIAAKEVEE